MSNILPFRRNKPKYQNIVTVNLKLEAPGIIAAREAYRLLQITMESTSDKNLKNDINCILGAIEDSITRLESNI